MAIDRATIATIAEEERQLDLTGKRDYAGNPDPSGRSAQR